MTYIYIYIHIELNIHQYSANQKILLDIPEVKRYSIIFNTLIHESKIFNTLFLSFLAFAKRLWFLFLLVIQRYSNSKTYGRWLRNPAPADRWFIQLFKGFRPSKVVQDFFHPQFLPLFHFCPSSAPPSSSRSSPERAGAASRASLSRSRLRKMIR